MSSATDEDERKRRSLEAGREMLKDYKAERASKAKAGSSQADEGSDEESYHNDKSMEHRESCAHEGISSRDMTHSSVSMSEGEGDGDLEGLARRVAKLEELLQGKEAVVEALNAEIDHLRAEASSPNSSQSQNSSIHGRDILSLYHTKLQEFEKAIKHRDNLIEDLTWSLEQALSARNDFLAQLNNLNAMQLSDKECSNAANINLQEKIQSLEGTLCDQKSLVQKLNAQLGQIQKHVQTLEMERETRNAEINDYKLQINNLNERIRLGAADKDINIAETLEQQKQYDVRVDKIKQNMQHILEKFTAETNENNARHQQETKDLSAKHETEILNIQEKYEEHMNQLKAQNKMLTDRLNKDIPELENRHAKELSVFQAQLVHYKKTVETLKLELVNRSESQQSAQAEVSAYKSKIEEMKIQAENSRRIQDVSYQKEKEMLNEQIELHKLQLEEITSKYVAATAVLESKESIERSLEQALTNAATLKEENSALKFKLDDLSSRYSAAQSLIENTQAHERTLSTRIYDLEKSLSRLSGINISTLSELNDTTYQTFDEIAIQYQMAKQKLDEKAELEKMLVDKIQGLENDVRNTKEELEEANLTKKSYEKQLKDMKNTCDKFKSELSILKDDSLQISDETKLPERYAESVRDLLSKTEDDQRQIKSLKLMLEQKESENADYTNKLHEITEKLKKSDEECEQLRSGLASAWAQCAEVEEKLNQTLALNETNVDISLSTTNNGNTSLNQLRQSKVTNESMNSTHYQSAESGKSFVDKNELDGMKIKLLQEKLDSTTEVNEKLMKQLEQLTEKCSDYDVQKNKLQHYMYLAKCLSGERERITGENSSMKKKLANLPALQECVNQLRFEKESLKKEVEALINVHDEQMNAVKMETAVEIRKMQSLLLSVKEGTTDIHDDKVELVESKHAKEMEELRMYFEQKCLQIEKQYSEEIFSLQSKKMSDNDSEIADLTDGLYFGAGDCLNASNISASASRMDSPVGDEQSNQDNDYLENRNDSKHGITLKGLQEELEKKVMEIQELKENYEKSLEEQKSLYERELYDVREKRRHEFVCNLVSQHCQTEWDAGALENGELSQLRAAYNHQLEEQVALAKVDIVNALQEQIQALLTVEPDGEDNWPQELLELRDKFTSNAREEMQQIKELHAAELFRLKEEHSRNMARMIDRHHEELKKIKAEAICSYSGSKHTDDNFTIDQDIVKERNNLNKTCATLKILVEELIKYFVICEEEVNNTLITEVLKRQLSDSLNTEKTVQTEELEIAKLNESKRPETSDVLNTSEIRLKRVHFAPQSSEIVSIINSDTNKLQNMFEEDEDIAEKLKQELNNCLCRLKSESAEILGNSSSKGRDQLDLISKEIMWMNKVNEELNLKLAHAEDLINNYQEETEELKINILELQRKLANAENKKEIITEGYGEHDDTGGEITMQDFSQLQEKARHVLSNGGGDCAYLLQLIEELCRQSDKLMEDARKEKEDLQQQQVPLEPTPTPYIHRVCCRKIEAADKQLKGTRRFLDEQASEREAERDEAARQIHLLQEQLKEREREKERDLRITSEVEALETQMREMSSVMSDTEAKKIETESELQAAVDKIWVLREIVTDLEQQLQTKMEKEQQWQLQITQLETVIAAQTKNQHELVQELDSIKMGSESRHLNEHINQLQEELTKHKLSSEQFNVNSSALKQMKSELRDMQNQLDKRIKDLESVHMCSSNLSLSQPSEDVSVREQIDAARCPTPDDPTSPPMLPLDQLLKLKEKMIKHARAEEVAFKRIKDLEMQLTTLKNQNEELQAEQDILQQTASEQLFQIEAMRGRLEQHKQSAPFAQRQATSRLELQLHEANSKFQSLERTIADKDLELKDMKNQLDRVNQLLLEKEAEIANVVQVETATIKKLKEHLEIVEEEKKILQAKVGVQEHAQLELPRLIDSMLADKNEEIDHLKDQLSKKEKQLEIYSSVTLDDAQLREMMKQAEAKNSARTLSDILSIHSECEDMVEAIRTAPNAMTMLPNISTIKVPTFTTLSKDTLDASMVPLTETNISVQIPPLELGSHSHSFSETLQQHCAGLIHSGSESKTSSDSNVSMEDTNCSRSKHENDKFLLQETDDNKRNNGESNSLERNQRKCLVMSVKETQTSINESIKEVEYLENQLQAVQEELQVKSMILEKRGADLIILQKLYEELQVEFREATETLTRDKCFYQNQYELSRVSENKIKKDLEEVENILKLRTEEIQEHKCKMQVNEKIIMELSTENTKLKKEIDEKAEEQIRKYTALLQEKAKELENLRDTILEKEIIIESIQTRNIEIENENKQLYEFKTKYQQLKQDMVEYENEIQRLTEGLNNRDQIIRRLEEMARRTSLSGTSSPSDEKDQEIHHLQEYLKEKDKVIRQMSDDSKSLHRALETIQNKMKESGNIVELRRKLKDERKLNAELRETVEKLCKELDDLKKPMQRSQDESDIEDMVQRELNLSARLDRQIMSAIESDSDGGVAERQSQDQILKSKLHQSNKTNEELKTLKDDLEVERGMLECQIAEYESRIFQLKYDLTEERKKMGKLDSELSTERNLVRSLKIQSEKNQRAMQLRHIQDAELAEFLKEKLKSSMENETKCRNELTILRQENKDLEMQLNSMKEQIQSQETDKLPKLTDLLESERKKYLALMENLEKEERINAELRDTLKMVQMEKNLCEKQLEVAMEEKEKLISSLALVEGVKEHLETDLRRTKEELKLREEECEWLQKRIKALTDAELKRQEQMISEHNELKALRREISNTREVMMDLEADMKQSKSELTQSLKREVKLVENMASLKIREVELENNLSAARNEEKKLKEAIADLQQNLELSGRRELDLSKQLKSKFINQKNVPVKYRQMIRDLTDANEGCTNEKVALEDDLRHIKWEKEQLEHRVKFLEAQVQECSKDVKSKHAPSMDKLNHFYGTYLRADSRRKALTYQKRYLLMMLSSYHIFQENTLSALAQLTNAERSTITTNRNKKKPKVHFKAAVLVIISIHRMKWLIQRWRVGKRIGAKTLLKNMEQYAAPTQMPTLNHSPPIREKQSSKGNGSLDGFSFEQYYQRLRNIQQTLGLAMAETGNGEIITE